MKSENSMRKFQAMHEKCGSMSDPMDASECQPTHKNESVEKQLQRLGWNLFDSRQFVVNGEREYRASCGGFLTPWRSTEQAVLNDVLAIKAKENAEAVGDQKARFA